MRTPRLVRDGTPLEVSVLAAMAFVLGLGCLATAAHPMAADAPRVLPAGIGSLGVLVGLLLARTGRALPPAILHGILVGLVLLRGVVVAAAVTERGLMLGAFGCSWAAVYVAFFLSPREARLHATLITAVLAVALTVTRASTDLAVWVWIVATVWAAVEVLTRVNARVRDEGRIDPLTGLRNRTGFALDAGRERASALRRGEPVLLAVLDLDGFKAVNDRLGHAAGDRLLTALAAAWSSSLRPCDLLARFGGDEFVLLLPGVEEEGARVVLDRLAAAHPVRWTAGTARCAPDEPLDEALARADALLYEAKRASPQAASHPAAVSAGR